MASSFGFSSLAINSLTRAMPAHLAKEADEIEAKYTALLAMEKTLSKTTAEYYLGTWRKAEMAGVAIPENDKELLGALPLQNDPVPRYINIAKYPFAMGGVRAAYHAKLSNDAHGTDAKDVIVKEFMNAPLRTMDEYRYQSENSAVCHYLIRAFCERILRKDTFHACVKSRILKVTKHDGSLTLYNMEDCLSGDFKKWTTNGGFVLEKNNDLFRFSKWSHDMSKGYLLVSDLQGVQEATGRVVLTDPAVLCTDLSRFGATNFSPAQMTMCLEAIKSGLCVKGSVPFSLRSDGFSLHKVKFHIFALLYYRNITLVNIS